MDRPEDIRDKERVPVPLTGEVKVYQPMSILDLSMGGVQVETLFALRLDSLHDFRISLGERSIVVKGRIAHCHIGELQAEGGGVVYRSGVEFIEPSEHVRTAIGDFLDAVKAGQQAPPIIDAELAE